MGFSRQEYWSGLPFPSSGDLPNSGIEPRSPALQVESLPTELWGKPYLRLLIFLPAILILACDSSSPAFCMMFSAWKLNKQGGNLQPWHIPFPIWNQSVAPCSIITVVFWPTFRFLRRQVRWSGIPISFRIIQFVVIYTVKGFSEFNEAKVDVFSNYFAFSMIQWMLAIWSLVPLPFLNPAWTSGRFMYCWSLAWRILSIILLACDMSVVV